MPNLKLTLKNSLKDGRDKVKSSDIMRVLSSEKVGDIFKITLSGDNVRVIKKSPTNYFAGDLLIISDGEIIGKSANSVKTYYV